MGNKEIVKEEVSTILSSALITRRSSNSPISEIDMENYATESVWRIFDRLRRGMAMRLDISEVDIVLVEAKILEVRIDGYKVLNAEGFTGREIEISAMFTIATKGFNAVKFTKTRDSGTLKAYAISKKLGEPGVFYVEPTGSDKTLVFASAYGESKALGSISWSELEVSEAVSNIFMSTQEIACKIYGRFLRGDLPKSIHSRIEDVLIRSAKRILQEMSSLARAYRETSIDKIFIKSDLIPDSFHKKQFLFNGKKIRIMKSDNEAALPRIIEDHERAYAKFNSILDTRIKWSRV